MRHVVSFSGGIGSWMAARRVVETNGPQAVTLLFANPRSEDEDTYRFLIEASCNLGVPLTTISDGRTPWQVFRDEKFLGNSRIDPCSKILKRQLIDRWLSANCDPASTTVVVGIDWSEEHRYTRLRDRKLIEGWRYEAPLCDAPYLTKTQMFAALEAEGIKRPRLYDLGFAHNNCGGFCIKAGQGHFINLLRRLPDRYAYHEQQEQDIRRELGDVSILTDRAGDKKKGSNLRQLRERHEAAPELIDLFDVGGCGCAIDDADEVPA